MREGRNIRSRLNVYITSCWREEGLVLTKSPAEQASIRAGLRCPPAGRTVSPPLECRAPVTEEN